MKLNASSNSSESSGFRLVCEEAFDGNKQLAGYRYQVVISKFLTRTAEDQRVTLHESYIDNDPLNQPLHNDKASAAYENYITNFKKHAEKQNLIASTKTTLLSRF